MKIHFCLKWASQWINVFVYAENVYHAYNAGNFLALYLPPHLKINHYFLVSNKASVM